MIYNFKTAIILDDAIEKLQEIRKKYGGKIKLAFDSDEENMQYPVLNIYVGKIHHEDETFALLTDIEDIENYEKENIK